MQKRAKIIAFSGIDGSGKTTQLKLVKEELLNKNVYISKLDYTPLNDMGKNKIFDLLLEARSGLEILNTNPILFFPPLFFF